jgi:NitT/TauT family transport system permease protein
VLWALGNPLIAATYPIPKIALLPLMILWLGIGEAPKVAMIALGVFFPVVINAYAGVQGTDPLMVKAARSLGAGRWQVLLKVVLPSALPTILAGYRLGAGIALLLVVSAEMINATSGIGFLILHSGDLMLTAKLMVGLAVLSFLGLASTWGLRALEAWLVPWREDRRG